MYNKRANMARYRQHKKPKLRSRKVNKREIYSAVYKSRKLHKKARKRDVITGGANPPPSYSRSQPSQSRSLIPKIGFTDRARVLGAEITHKVKVVGREIVDKLTIGSPLKTKIKNFKNAYSAFRLQSMKFDLQVKEMINYFNGTINAKLLTPISAGTVAGGIFSKKPTKPIITVSDASMASSLSNKFLYRLANIRNIPTQNFLDRCSMGSIKKNIAKVKNAVTLKVIRKHTSDKMSNFDRYGEPQYRFLLCRIYNYRVAEIAYNNAYQSLVTITGQVLNDPALTGIIKLPGNMYSKTRYNSIRYFDTSQTPITQLDKQVDTLVNQLNALLKPGDTQMDKKADFIPGKILKTLTKPLDKITKSITWIITNALYHAKRVDITLKLFYNLTNIRPTDELTYTPKEYTNWFLSASQKDRESKASDRREFITRLNQLNLRFQELANAIKPSVERLIKNEMDDTDSELDVKEEQIKALEYAYRYFNKPGRQSVDVGMALEAMGADPTLTLHGSKPTLSTVIERIRTRINELKGLPTDSTGPVTNAEEENEFELDMENEVEEEEVGGSSRASLSSTSPSPISAASSSVPIAPSLSFVAPPLVPGPLSPGPLPPAPKSGSLHIITGTGSAKFVPSTNPDNTNNNVTSTMTGGLVRKTPEREAGAKLGGMEPSPNNRRKTSMVGGAIFDEYLTPLTSHTLGPTSKSNDYPVNTINGYSYINITNNGLQTILSSILFLLQRPFFIADKTLLERGKMAKQGDKPYESISFKTTYYNYLAKLDMGVTEFDIKQSHIPVIFPDTTMLNNLPGFVSTYLYRQFYALSPDVNHSDLCLIDLQVLDKLTQKETGRSDEEMIANKHYVYHASKSSPDKDKERILELFGEAAKQGTHITIPPSFLQYALLTPAELAQLLEMADIYGGLDLGDLRDRVTKQTLNPGKMADLKVLMDDAGILIIRDIYERLSVYMKNSPVISQDTKDDFVLRAAFDNCLSKIMLFLKLNHLFGDFIKFKKFANRETNNEETEDDSEYITVGQFIEVARENEFDEDQLAYMLLMIGMSDEISDRDKLGAMLKELPNMFEGDESEDKPISFWRPVSGKLIASPTGTSMMAGPSRSTDLSLQPTAKEPLKSILKKADAASSLTTASTVASHILAIPPAAVTVHNNKTKNNIHRVSYCAYPVSTLNIAKKEIHVTPTGNVNLQVATGFLLLANDIVRLPLTSDSKVYTLARPGDTSTPYTTSGPGSDIVNAHTIKLPTGSPSVSGLYIVTRGKKANCEAADARIIKQIKFNTSDGIGSNFRIITDNTDDLPKSIPASVSSPVSTILGPSNAAKPINPIANTTTLRPVGLIGASNAYPALRL